MKSNDQSVSPQVNEGREVKRAAILTRATYYKVVVIIVAILVLIVSGAIASQFLSNVPSETPQNTVGYTPPSAPSGWLTSTIPFDGKTFSFAHPSDWSILGRYDEQAGLYSDLRIVTSDYVDVASTDDIPYEGIVREGAVFDIRVTKNDGSLESYKRNIETGDTEKGIIILGGYGDLKLSSILGRPAITYLQKMNFVRTVIVKEGQYLVHFYYFQPYRISNSSQQPELKDTHLEQLHSVVASFSRT